MKLELILKKFPVVSEMLNAFPHGIACLDRDFSVITMNRALEAMTGYTLDEARGIYGEFILRTSLGSNSMAARRVLAGGQTVSEQGTIVNRSRQKIPVHFTLSRFHDPGDVPAGVILVIEDVSSGRDRADALTSEYREFGILGRSRQMEDVFELMNVLARTDASVLVTGETGTGKDKIAEQLHRSSRRSRQPFIKVNCGALPEALLESELFGHVKGAFTGAVSNASGMFRMAHRGTIFLTEIGDLSLPLQVKLLSVLDDHAFYPVGGGQKVEVDVRVIAATHRQLREEVERGNFREDLFYRLNVLHLHIPPLREREGDIRLLLDHFLTLFKTKLTRKAAVFSNAALDVLSRYGYPGNVRELRNIVEYAVTVCQGEKIEKEDLPPYLLRPAADRKEQEKTRREPPGPSVVQKPERSEAARLGNWAAEERERIMEVLRSTGGNRTETAKILGWGRTTLWRKLKKYNIA